MDRELVNIVEYLALGEIEAQLSADYVRQPSYYDAEERKVLLQQVLNRVPPIYMLLAANDVPAMSMLNTSEQDYLRNVVQLQLQGLVRQTDSQKSPYAYLMTEIFY